MRNENSFRQPSVRENKSHIRHVHGADQSTSPDKEVKASEDNVRSDLLIGGASDTRD